MGIVPGCWPDHGHAVSTSSIQQGRINSKGYTLNIICYARRNKMCERHHIGLGAVTQHIT